MATHEAEGALTQLRAFLAQQPLPEDGRLPPERDLCRQLGVTRSALRKALAALATEGLLWRHVGKGTFLGPRPAEGLADVRAITDRTNPAEVMLTRRLIEPEIARAAALCATAEDLLEMRRCMAHSKAARSWREYENCDNQLHRTIAEATHNSLLLALFDTLNAVRRAVVWGRLRPDRSRPPAEHHSFAEHEAIVAAIAERDRERAAAAMRRHLASVEHNLMRFDQVAE